MPAITTPIRDADLLALLDREAARLELDNDHSAAVLLRLAAERIRLTLRDAA